MDLVSTPAQFAIRATDYRVRQGALLFVRLLTSVYILASSTCSFMHIVTSTSLLFFQRPLATVPTYTTPLGDLSGANILQVPHSFNIAHPPWRLCISHCFLAARLCTIPSTLHSQLTCTTDICADFSATLHTPFEGSGTAATLT